jgi:hypothetical protein
VHGGPDGRRRHPGGLQGRRDAARLTGARLRTAITGAAAHRSSRPRWPGCTARSGSTPAAPP